jgi:cystathionine gamma-synthase
MNDKANRPLSPETITAQAMGGIDPETRALVPPVHLSTTFERDADGGYSSGRAYARPHYPGYDEPEALLTALEGGAESLLFASGMAAATAVFQALLPGDHVVAPRVMYWALRKWLVDFALPWGLEVDFVDTGDESQIEAAVRPGQTRLVWIETPANPTWAITDIARTAEIAHAAGARLAVDSTVSTPVLSRPIEYGADLVLHSASKALNGHSDVLAGALVGARQDAFWQRLRAWRRDGGAMLGPFEAWLLLRGMRTLFPRVRQCSASALQVARHFAAHPALAAVLYPGLAEHPGHAVAARQMSGGFGSMLSLRLKGGEAAAMQMAARVQVFTRATSLGGVESLIEHRASIEGPATPVPADLLRLSIGLEDPGDLIADLEQALEGLPEIGESEMPAVPVPNDPIELVLDNHLRPQLRERGGDLVVRSLQDGVLELGIEGSPGAVVAVAGFISNTVQHYLPEIKEVRLAAPAPTGDAAARLQALLDDEINPAVAAHEGRIVLAEFADGVARLRLEGGCQGCAMAEMTLRQGVEPMLRAALPEITVVDVTDHAAGRAPYFKTKKGSS